MDLIFATGNKNKLLEINKIIPIIQKIKNINGFFSQLNLINFVQKKKIRFYKYQIDIDDMMCESRQPF